MPTELQIIDDVEKLRVAFARANPELASAGAWAGRASGLAAALGVSDADGIGIEERIAGAWLLALMGKPVVNAEARRVVRAGVRAALAGEGLKEFSAALTKGTAAQVGGWRGDFKGVLAQAARRKLWPVDEAAPERSPAEEAATWRNLLPGLGGLAGWRFLKHLGRPLLVAEPPVRRFFWRYGLLDGAAENGSDKAESGAAVNSAFDRMRHLSGLGAEMLAAMLRWHAVGERELAGGKICVAQPLCDECPMRGGCVWVKFHKSEVEETGNGMQQEQLARAKEELAAGRQADLQESELLGLILQAGAPGQSAMELGAELLRQLGGLRGLERASLMELQQVRGVAPGRAQALKAALELGRRFASEGMRPGEPFTTAIEVWRAYRGRFQHLAQEHFVVILLDKRNRVIFEHVISKGTLDGSFAHPRDVFHQAVRHSAASLILMHNHPSGDPSPSADDVSITKRLKEAGEILGIKVLDHIILGAETFYSFAERA